MANMTKTHAEAIRDLEEATDRAKKAEALAAKQHEKAQEAAAKADQAAADAAKTVADAQRVIAESQRKIAEAAAEQRCSCGTRRFIESFIIDAAGNLSDGGSPTYQCAGCGRVYVIELKEDSTRANLKLVVNASSLAGWRTL